MSKRRIIGIATVGVAVLALAGGLIASNMGFKLNYTLIAATQTLPAGEGAATSLDGTNTLGLPDFRQSGLAKASDLRTDIGASFGPSITKFLRASNGTLTYTGNRSGSVDFNLEAGVGYRVRVTGTTNASYIVVGSDDPATPVTLVASTQPVPEGGTSLDGTNDYAYAYHSTATTASALRTDIGTVFGPSITKFLRGTNGTLTYTGNRSGSVDFNLAPGESYRVRITGTTSANYLPSHY